MKTSQDIINYLIEIKKYTRFLEIGVRGGSLNKIKCEHIDGVDITYRGNNYVMSSDEFFETIPADQMYDIIYVDGCHEKTQVLKDIENSLKHLNDGGTILCHDINPPDKKLLDPRFCNNCWEAWAQLRSTREDLEMYALDIDFGPGIIRRGSQSLYDDEIESSWDYLNNNRKQLLNEITVKELLEII